MPPPSSPAEEQRRLVRGHILFTIAILLLLATAWRLREVLELVYVSALFAVVLMPLVKRIERFRVGKYHPSRVIAILGLMVTVVSALFLLFFFGLPPVLRDIQHFAGDLPTRLPLIVGKLKKLPIANKIGIDNLAQRGENSIAALTSYLVDSMPKWLGHILDLLTALILCVYFMLEGAATYSYFLSMVPARSRDRLARTATVAEQRMSKWLLGQGSLMLILGVCSTIVFACLHVRYFFLLGALMGLFNIIPIIGAVITVLLAAGIAALDSWSKMAGVFIFYAIYAQIENAFLTPRIMRTSVNLMGLSVLIALLAGSALAGVVGALVSVPTAALVAVLVQEYVAQRDAAAIQLQKEADTTAG
ncbi:MAG: AI-2E family transporter [Janthinobacterium lividum]